MRKKKLTQKQRKFKSLVKRTHDNLFLVLRDGTWAGKDFNEISKAGVILEKVLTAAADGNISIFLLK